MVTQKDVEHVAMLSKLEIKPEEQEMYVDQLNQILEWQEKLSELQLDNYEPKAHVLEMKNAFREDVKRESLSNDEALKNAPNKEGTYFKVPRIIE